MNFLINSQHERIQYANQFINTRNHYVVFTEFCNGLDLEWLLRINQTLNHDQVREIMKQIVDGVNYLGSQGIAHWDL